MVLHDPAAAIPPAIGAAITAAAKAPPSVAPMAARGGGAQFMGKSSLSFGFEPPAARSTAAPPAAAAAAAAPQPAAPPAVVQPKSKHTWGTSSIDFGHHDETPPPPVRKAPVVPPQPADGPAGPKPPPNSWRLKPKQTWGSSNIQLGDDSDVTNPDIKHFVAKPKAPAAVEFAPPRPQPVPTQKMGHSSISLKHATPDAKGGTRTRAATATTAAAATATAGSGAGGLSHMPPPTNFINAERNRWSSSFQLGGGGMNLGHGDPNTAPAPEAEASQVASHVAAGPGFKPTMAFGYDNHDPSFGFGCFDMSPAGKVAPPGGKWAAHATPQTKTLITDLKVAICRQGCGAKGLAGLAQRFRLMDKDGAGTVDAKEFAKTMHEFAPQWNARETRDVFDYFDGGEGDDAMAYDEFLHGLRGDMSAKRADLVLLAFELQDVAKTGVVDIDDLLDRFDAALHPDVLAGVRTPNHVMREFLHTFDAGEADGKVTVAGFCEYYKNVSAAFEVSRRGDAT